MRGAQREHVVAKAERVRVVLLDAQLGFVVQQLTQDVGRITHGRGDDLGVEGRVLIRDVGVEGDAGAGTVAEVHLTGLFPDAW